MTEYRILCGRFRVSGTRTRTLLIVCYYGGFFIVYQLDAYGRLLRIERKVVVVIEGNSGIGRDVCNLFSLEGATVIFTYTKGQQEDIDDIETFEIIRKAKHANAKDPMAIVVDLGYEENCKRVVDELGFTTPSVRIQLGRPSSLRNSLESLGETFRIVLQWSGRNSMTPVSGCPRWCPIYMVRPDDYKRLRGPKHMNGLGGPDKPDESIGPNDPENSGQAGLTTRTGQAGPMTQTGYAGSMTQRARWARRPEQAKRARNTNRPGRFEDPNGPSELKDPNGLGGPDDPNGSGGLEEPNGSGRLEEPNRSGGPKDPNGPHGPMTRTSQAGSKNRTSKACPKTRTGQADLKTQTGQADPKTRTGQVGSMTKTNQAGPKNQTGQAGQKTRTGQTCPMTRTDAVECDLFVGDWVPDLNGPRYNNESCRVIEAHQNCMKNGRPDSGYLYWRWNPRGCELPKFSPSKFLDMMRDKSWAFIGDSISRNHVQSLLCLLSQVLLHLPSFFRAS
ncbi:Protein trichome birefringence-like 25/26 [Vigna unguiculata]|uniref:Protein trichome birefringence-like 25/26 n=1 Tax=Vigna unguiculata TaxID=3917 RepID=A0A4D6MQS4_VIGUN|nr:Protein trichome birefringence-like 25/26 [Vigna unguiculata]